MTVLIVYTVFAFLTAFIYTVYYYHNFLKTPFKTTTPTMYQKISAFTIAFVGSFILAPVVWLDVVTGKL